MPEGNDDGLDELRLLRQAQSLSAVGSWHFDLVTRRLRVSRTCATLFGLRAEPGDGYTSVDYADLEPWFGQDEQERVRQAIATLVTCGEDTTLRLAAHGAAGGSRRHFDVRGVAEHDHNGSVTHLVGTVTDVTNVIEGLESESRLRLEHAELTESHKHQQAVIEGTPDAFHVYDVRTGSLARANRSGKPLIGFTNQIVDALSGTDVDTLVPVDERRQLAQLFLDSRALRDGAVAQLRHRVRHDGGEVRWVSRRVTPFKRDDDGTVTELLVVSRDVTDVVAVEERLEYAALHDELTGLANRRLVHDRLENSLQCATRDSHVAVLVCDLDGFKRINDAYGHHVGDRVLTETATRMGGAIRPVDTIARISADEVTPADTIARMGGDEFAVVLDIPERADPAAVSQQVAQRIATSLATPFVVDAREHRISVSIGIAIAAGDAHAESLLNDADAAMYHIKSRGGNGHALYEASHRADTAASDELERHIRRALAADDGIAVYYQPIIDPRTGVVHSVEALLRVRDDSGQTLDTAQVVAVAERTGLIAMIDERVLELACGQTVAWRRDPALAHLMLNVNLSAYDITRDGFYSRISNALASTGLDPQALTLELTETVLLDATPAVRSDLSALHQLGVGLAIDDFGTGYASLRYLAELPISCIKIDQSFTSRLPADPTAMALVRATVSLAEQLNIHCTVEGVEIADQLAALPHYQHLLVQGYFYARPQPADGFVGCNAFAQLPARSAS